MKGKNEINKIKYNKKKQKNIVKGFKKNKINEEEGKFSVPKAPQICFHN